MAKCEMKCKIYYKDNTCFEGYLHKAPHLYKDSSKILHREDGPAIEWPCGDKGWYLNNKLHREDGPAMIWENGSRWWYLNGRELRTLTKKYLIRYMELTGETSAMLLVHPEEIVRNSVKKYKWS